jgi:hypothetical protein
MKYQYLQKKNDEKKNTYISIVKSPSILQRHRTLDAVPEGIHGAVVKNTIKIK